MPRVSVIIPTYNRVHAVCQAVDSVLAQTFQDLEIIVVDDGSTDDTQEVLANRYGDQIVYVYQENQERCVARNTGIGRACGQYVAFLDSDDIWLPEKLEAQMEMASRYPEAGLLYGRVFPIDTDGEWHLREAEIVGWGDPVPRRIFEKLVMVNVIPTPTAMVKRAYLDHVGLFDKSFSYCEDWDLWLRIALHYDVVFVPEALAGARVYDDIPTRLAAYGSEMSQIRILDKVFSDLPDGMRHLADLKPRAVASRYLAAACRDYALGKVSEGRAHMRTALSLDETYARDPERLIGVVVDQGFFLAGPLGTSDDVLPVVDRVFADLPSIAGRYGRMRSKARARTYIVDAFREYEGGDLPAARRKALYGVFRDQSWLFNRGVISMLLKSVTGQRGRRGTPSRMGFKGSGLERTYSQ